MAKRKRLELPAAAQKPETESDIAYSGMSRMPIAGVAGDSAAHAALDEVSREMERATSEGRLVQRLALDVIDTGHLNRDRMVFDADEMAALRASLAERGQQTPIEVLPLGAGRYGLISGLRRVRALREIGQEDVLAFVRAPQTASDSYVAMVEENEIRAGLSFYERANIVVQAVGSGVFPSEQAAVKALFANVAAAKRSKILRFVLLRRMIGPRLSFPAAIPEKLGLALATAIEADKAVGTRIGDALRKTPPADAAAERRVLERALKGPRAARATDKPARSTTTREEVAPGLVLSAGPGRATLSGARVDAALVAALRDWLAQR